MNLYNQLIDELTGLFGVPVSFETPVLNEGFYYIKNLTLSLTEGTKGNVAHFSGTLFYITQSLNNLQPGTLLLKTMDSNGCFGNSEIIMPLTNNATIFISCQIAFADYHLFIPVIQKINQVKTEIRPQS